MKKNTKILEKKLNQPGHKLELPEVYFVLTSLFIISAIYFYRFANYIFFYQENQSLFVFSIDYFRQFADRPGGLLEYAGVFLTQGYFNYVYGAIILAGLFTLLAIVYIKINKKLSPDNTYYFPLILIPSSLLILIQTNINWLIHCNIGFLLATLYFLASIISDKKSVRIISLAFFPLFFYFVGGFAWIYVCMYILYSFLFEKLMFPLILLIIAFVSLLLFKEVLFLQPFDLLIHYPLPIKDYFPKPLFYYILTGIFITYPVLVKTSYLIKINKVFANFISQFASPFILLILIVILSKLHNPVIVNWLKLEKYLYQQDWDSLIKHQETVRSTNIIAQYYYNIALSERGQLCERMFSGPQNFSTNTILIGKIAQNDHLRPEQNDHPLTGVN